LSLQEAESVTANLFLGHDPGKINNYIASLKNILIIKTSWYPEVIDGLEKSALEYLKKVNINKFQTIVAPGAYELPLLCSKFSKDTNVNFIVVLGCVIKGDTPHFDFICQNVISSIQDIQINSAKAIGMGVLTTNNIQQATKRVSKGWEATQAALINSYVLSCY